MLCLHLNRLVMCQTGTQAQQVHDPSDSACTCANARHRCYPRPVLVFSTAQQLLLPPACVTLPLQVCDLMTQRLGGGASAHFRELQRRGFDKIQWASVQDVMAKLPTAQMHTSALDA
jgi:hypothetical protein